MAEWRESDAALDAPSLPPPPEDREAAYAAWDNYDRPSDGAQAVQQPVHGIETFREHNPEVAPEFGLVGGAGDDTTQAMNDFVPSDNLAEVLASPDLEVSAEAEPTTDAVVEADRQERIDEARRQLVALESETALSERDERGGVDGSDEQALAAEQAEHEKQVEANEHTLTEGQDPQIELARAEVAAAYPETEADTPPTGVERTTEVALDGDEQTRPTYEELDGLHELPITDLHEVGGLHANGVYEVEMLDGAKAFLKAQNEELAGLRGDAIPAGTEWSREVAASDVDDLLGLNVVPETVARSEDQLDMDHASLQAEAPRDGLPRDEYSVRDQQSMAVLDYVLGNTDRHSGNYRTTADGHVAAIDNGLVLPESDDTVIRSGFVTDWFGQPLDAELVSQVSQVSPDELRATLERHDIGERAVAGAVERLREIQRVGAITGRSWQGLIRD